jgi:hypothetical protein
MALVTPFFGGGGFVRQVGGILRATLSDWRIALPVIAVVAAACWILCKLVYSDQVVSAVFVAAAAAALVVAVWALMLYWMLRRHWLPAFRNNFFGICTGGTSYGPGTKPGQPPFDGLSLWMHRIVRKRRAAPSPMTR